MTSLVSLCDGGWVHVDPGGWSGLPSSQKTLVLGAQPLGAVFATLPLVWTACPPAFWGFLPCPV